MSFLKVINIQNPSAPNVAMTFSTVGNVGIGSASPAYTLDVAGTINAAVINTGIFNIGNISVPTANVGNLIVTNNASINSSNIYVNGNTPSLSTITGALVLTGGAGVSGNIYAGGNIVAASFQPTLASVPSAGLYLAASNTLALSTNNAERMRIISSGNVGINIASPGYRLEVNGNSGIQASFITNVGAGDAGIRIQGERQGSDGDVAFINLDNFNYSTPATYTMGRISSGMDGSTLAGAADGNLKFYTSLGGAITERMRINNYGNVLIGTTTRTLNQNATMVINSTFGGGLELVNNNSGGGNLSALSTGGLAFGTFTGAVGSEAVTERMRITSAGQVGIATTNPSQALTVNGAALLTNPGATNEYLYFDSTAWYVGRNVTTGDLWHNTASSQNQIFGVNSAEKMRMNSSGYLGINSTNPTAYLTIGSAVNSYSVGAINALITASALNTGGLVVGGSIGTAAPAGAGTYIYANTSTGYGGIQVKDFTTNYYSLVLQEQGGLVGIGVNNPSFTLDVQAATAVIRAQSTTGTNSVKLQAQNTGGTLQLGIDTSTGTTFFASTAYGRAIYSDGAYPLGFFTNAQERMRLTPGTAGAGASNLLIGTTTAPAGGNATVVISGAGTNGGGIELAGSGSGGGNIAGLTAGGLVFGSFTGAVGSEVYTETARINSSGQLGLGTPSPGSTLDVNGVISARTAFSTAGAASVSSLISNGSITGTTITGTSLIPTGAGTPSNGMFLPAANTVGFATQSNERMRLTAGTAAAGASNLLIGTTTTPQGGNATVVISGTGTNGGGIELVGGAAGGGNIYGINGSGLVFSGYTGAPGSEVSTERMRITATGNLLVATTTSYGTVTATSTINPANTAWLNASFTGSGAYGGGVSLLDSGAAGWSMYTTGTGTQLNFAQGLATAGTAITMRLLSGGNVLIGTISNTAINTGVVVVNSAYGGGVELVNNNNGGGNVSAISTGGLAFSTFTGAVGSEVVTERMRIDSNGYMGIGTPTPQVPLGVTRNSGIYTPDTLFDVAWFGNGTSGSGAGVHIVSATNGKSELGFSNSSTRNAGLLGYNMTSNYMYFLTSSTERMRITALGNVGINTSTVATGTMLAVAGGNIQAVSANSGFIFSDGTYQSTAATPGLIRAPQILTSGTSYTTPSNCNHIYVEVVGGGGGSAPGYCAGGGGGGGYSAKYFSVSPSTAYTYAIGAGGTAGGNGGTTSFTGPAAVTIQATGGSTSTGGTGTQNGNGLGGAGGIGSGGDLNVTGQGGSGGVAGMNGLYGNGGQGGSSVLGGGGYGNNSGAGIPGGVYGGGAGGCGYVTQTGAAGAQGVIRIWEFI